MGVLATHIKPCPAAGSARGIFNEPGSELFTPEDLHGSPEDLAAAEAGPAPLCNKLEMRRDIGALGSRSDTARPRFGRVRGMSRLCIIRSRSTRPAAVVLDPATARVLVREALEAGMAMRWRDGISKSKESGGQFLFYSKAKAYTQFNTPNPEMPLSGIKGMPAWSLTRLAGL